MIFYEYSDIVVERGIVPAKLCCSLDVGVRVVTPHIMTLMADKVYRISGNAAEDLKDRSGICKKWHITDEDKLALILKAVLI
jgi:hypothetical protein